MPSGEAMLELLDIDVVQIGALGPIVETAKHEDFSYRAREPRWGDNGYLKGSDFTIYYLNLDSITF